MSAGIRQAIASEANTWLGTPYHHHGRLRGVGVDCAMLLAEVFHTLGLAPALDPGHYPPDWHLHRGDELFLRWVQRAGALEVPQPRLGDVGVWRFGRTYSHGGIVVGTAPVPLLVHAYIDARRVTQCALDEAPLAGRPVRWFTLLQD